MCEWHGRSDKPFIIVVGSVHHPSLNPDPIRTYLVYPHDMSTHDTVN